MRWVAAIFVLGLAGLAAAAPVIQIKAKTRLVFSRARLVADGVVEVVGRLVDKNSDEGLAGERVTISVGGNRDVAVTDESGWFDKQLPADPNTITQKIIFTYEGGRDLDAAEVLTVETDPAKSQVRLDIKKVADDLAGARLRVLAAIEDAYVDQLPIEISIAPAGSDQFGAPFEVRSNAEFALTRKQAGGPGLRRIRAVFAGDDTRQRAHIDMTLELSSGTTTTMSLSSQKLAFEDDLTVSGSVTDDDQQAVEKAAVTLTSGDRRLAHGVTDASGHYRFKVEAEVIGEGQFGVQVQADPGTSFVRPSRSEPIVIRIAAPQPVPVSYTVAAFIATVIAAGGFFAARSKPWQRLRRRPPPAEQDSVEVNSDEPVQGGLVVAKPSLVSTLRRAADDGFSGVVRDTIRGRPIAQAVVRLLNGDSEREVRTTLDGNFAIEGLAPGEWRAEVAAAGHVTEKFTVTIPHRGELRGVRIDMVPVRERVFQLYRRAAEPILPESRLWGIWSPRQIVDHVRAKKPSPALAELTDFVEEIYFSPRLAEETSIPTASEHVDRAVRERSQQRAPRV